MAQIRYVGTDVLCKMLKLDEQACVLLEAALYTASTLPSTFREVFIQDFVASLNRRGIVLVDEADKTLKEFRSFVEYLVEKNAPRFLREKSK